MSKEIDSPNHFARVPRLTRARNQWLVEFLGWYGIVAILAAYALVSFEIIPPGSIFYQLLNLTGALGVIIISLAKKATQPAVLNIVWAAVALVAIISLVVR